MRISVEDDRMIITPLKDEPLTLEERLARFDPKRHGGLPLKFWAQNVGSGQNFYPIIEMP